MKYTLTLTGLSILSAFVHVASRHHGHGHGPGHDGLFRHRSDNPKEDSCSPSDHPRKDHCENCPNEDRSENCVNEDHRSNDPRHCKHCHHCRAMHGKHRGHCGKHHKRNHEKSAWKDSKKVSESAIDASTKSLENTNPREEPKAVSGKVTANGALSKVLLEPRPESTFVPDRVDSAKEEMQESAQNDETLKEGEVVVEEVPMESLPHRDESPLLSPNETGNELSPVAAAPRRLRGHGLLECPFENLQETLEGLLGDLPWDLLPTCKDHGTILSNLRELLPSDLHDVLGDLFKHSHEKKIPRALSHSLADHLINPRDHKDDTLINHLLDSDLIALPDVKNLLGDVNLKRDFEKLLNPIKNLLKCKKHHRGIDRFHSTNEPVHETRKNLIIEGGNLEIREAPPRRTRHHEEPNEDDQELMSDKHEVSEREELGENASNLVYVPTGERIPTQSMAAIEATGGADAVVIAAPLEEMNDPDDPENRFSVVTIDDDHIPNAASEDGSASHRKLGDNKDPSEAITQTSRNSLGLQEAAARDMEHSEGVPSTSASVLMDRLREAEDDRNHSTGLLFQSAEFHPRLRGQTSSAAREQASIRQSSGHVQGEEGMSEELREGTVEHDGSNRVEVVETPGVSEGLHPLPPCRCCACHRAHTGTSDAPSSKEDEVAWYPPYLAYPLGEDRGEFGVISIRDLVWARPLVEILAQPQSRPGRPHFLYRRPRETGNKNEQVEGVTQESTSINNVAEPEEIAEGPDPSRHLILNSRELLPMSHRVVGHEKPIKAVSHRRLGRQAGPSRFCLAHMLEELKLDNIDLPELPIPVVELDDLLGCLDLGSPGMDKFLECLIPRGFLENLSLPLLV